MWWRFINSMINVLQIWDFPLFLPNIIQFSTTLPFSFIFKMKIICFGDGGKIIRGSRYLDKSRTNKWNYCCFLSKLGRMIFGDLKKMGPEGGGGAQSDQWQHWRVKQRFLLDWEWGIVVCLWWNVVLIVMYMHRQRW